MKRGRFGTAKKAALSADANDRGATEEIGGSERRERASQVTGAAKGALIRAARSASYLLSFIICEGSLPRSYSFLLLSLLTSP